MELEIGLILEQRYPQADEGDYEVSERNGVRRISFWNEAKLGPKPTLSQLRSWWLGAEKWNRRRQFRTLVDADYEEMLAPDGVYTRVEKDEILEKKAANRAGARLPLSPAQQKASDSIDALRLKRVQKFTEINSVQQGEGESVEDAVTRVRAVSW